MEAPPVIGSDLPPPTPLIAPWRTLLMGVLMGGYPMAVGMIGVHLRTGAPGEAALPSTVSGLLLVAAENFGLFALLFLITAAIGRPSRDELQARGLPGPKAWALGFGYSVGLRIGIGLVALVALSAATVVFKIQGRPLDSLAAARPQVENLLDPSALQNPLYFVLSVSLVSFVVAGLREELWRAVVFATLLRLIPSWRVTVKGRLLAVAIAAVIFGLGHLPQGWGGVVLTGILGAGLGSILLFHRSLWIAVLAHGFFDATSFALIRLVDHFGVLDQVLGK